MNNGLTSVAINNLEFGSSKPKITIDPMDLGVNSLSELDSEIVAKEYLRLAFKDERIEDFDMPIVEGKKVSFEIDSIERMPLTNTKTVKFREYINDISVYGSLVTVKLNEKKELLHIFSIMKDNISINSVASISPYKAIKVAERHYKVKEINSTPLLYYYYLKNHTLPEYRLAYIIRNISLNVPNKKNYQPNKFVKLVDCVIDAHTAEVVDEIPKDIFNCLTDPKFVSDPNIVITNDIDESFNGGIEELEYIVLKDSELNVETYDFEFKDILDTTSNKLPGTKIISPLPPPPKFTKVAVSAHKNTQIVAKFIREKLGRRGVDGRGLAYVSTVNCCHKFYSNNQWPNAAWSSADKQVVYGQTAINGKLTSYATLLDTVSHELFHGITSFSSKLESRGMTGALNESYSDIFGIMVVNYAKGDSHWRNINEWEWELGKGISSSGAALRDLSNPSKYGDLELCPVYPGHMDDYKELSEDADNDWGGVHINSNIHNKAAYNLINSGLFDSEELVQLFYINLVTNLSKTSTFKDSLEGLQLTVGEIYPNRSQAEIISKIDAVRAAFAAVGIID